MELYLTNLYKLCHVCSGKKRGYVNRKTCSNYVDLIETCFEILVPEDEEVSENLNPFKYCRFLCSL